MRFVKNLDKGEKEERGEKVNRAFSFSVREGRKRGEKRFEDGQRKYGQLGQYNGIQKSGIVGGSLKS
jgi:hypothetical protein